MNEEFAISIGTGFRKESFDKLTHFLMNPGRFSVLVLGGRGTGKRTAVQYCYKKAVELSSDWSESAKKSMCLIEKAPLYVEPNEIPVDSELLDALLKKWRNKTVVLLNVDDLDKAQEGLLFKAMSTGNGQFGLATKDNEIRMVFTSSKPIKALREDEHFMSGVFWDRISQLAVILPDYQVEPECIMADFRASWQNMKFSGLDGIGKLATIPRNAVLERFLEEHAPKVLGGFRDLDKIAVLYLNYRLLYYGNARNPLEDKEDEVARSTKDDFWKLQLKSVEDDGLVDFRMDSQPSWNELHRSFKIQFRKWAQKKEGSLGKASEKLKIPYDTLKDFTERGLTRKSEG